jgi:hypothetical protein
MHCHLWGRGEQSFPSGCRQGERRPRGRCCDYVETWGRSQASRGIRWAVQRACRPADGLLAGDGPKHRPRKTLAKAKEQVPRTTDDKAARKAALAFAREQRRRENQRRKEEAARERQRQLRNQAIARAQAALEMSEREHQEVATIEAERNALEKKSQAEDARWAKEKDGLERALRRSSTKS